MIDDRLTNPEAVAKTSSSFQLAYDGPAVSDGSMDVQELAPALQALGDLLQRSNELMNGDNSRVTLRVVAGFDRGSFDINFLLNQGLRDPALALLPMLSTLDAAQLLDLALGTYDKAEMIVTGVAKIYKAFKGARPIDTRPGTQANTTILVFGSHNTIVADSGTARLYNDDRVRSALTRAASPLLNEGVDQLEVRRADKIVERLDRSDIDLSPAAHLAPSADETPAAPTRDLWVRVVKPNFDGGRWTFHDGSAKFGADVEDKGFQARVDSRDQGFFAGDTFLIRMRSVQHIDRNGVLTTRNVVEKVLDQKSSPKQRRLLDSTALHSSGEPES